VRLRYINLRLKTNG